MAFSPDRKTLAVGGINGNGDGAVWLWNVATGHQTGDFLTRGAVTSVASARTARHSPSEAPTRVMAMAQCSYGTWLPVSGLAPPSTSRAGAVSSVAFSGNGEALAAADGDGPARLWDVAYLANPIPYLCASAARFITPAEWAENVPGIPYQSVCP